LICLFGFEGIVELQMRLFGDEEVRQFLTSRGLEKEIYSFTNSTENAYLAAEALGVELGQIVKSVVFLADGKPVLVLMSGDKNVDNKKLKNLLGVRKVRIADAETVKTITGYPVGAVPPVAHRQSIPTYLDESLKRFSKIYPAAGTTQNMFRTNFDELSSLTAAEVIQVAAPKNR
jgi:Cys-tRNA(Pro) deacylase